MTAKTKAQNKAKFETGDIPTQADFEDLIDSYTDASHSVDTANPHSVTAAQAGAPGLASNNTLTGTNLFKPGTDALGSFQVQDRDGNIIFSVDTINNRIGFGTVTPSKPLEIYNITDAKMLVKGTDPAMEFHNDAVSFAARFAMNSVDGLFYIGIYNAGTGWTSPILVYSGAPNNSFVCTTTGVGIGTDAPTSKLQVIGLPDYANNAAAIAGGLTAGAFYRTGGDPDLVCVVH